MKVHRLPSPRRAGVAAVELAMLMPLLLLIFVVAVDFARVYAYAQILTDCARSGAAYLSNPDVTERSPFTTLEEAALAGTAHLKPVPAVVATYDTDGVGNPYVAVTATYSFRVLTQFPGLPTEVKLARTAKMRLTASALKKEE